MASAQAIQSTVNDLLKYTRGLLYGYHDQLKNGASSTPGMVLKHVVKQLSEHVSCGAPSMPQKAYCLGLYRHQLPNTLDGLGCNTMFVREMPILTPGNDTRLVLSHHGSLAGYSTFMALLPELDCSIAVLVNSIGLGDPAGWVYQLIIEALIDTPRPNDYSKLAKEAAQNHASSVANIAEVLENKKRDKVVSKPLLHYTGKYLDLAQDFFVEVK